LALFFSIYILGKKTGYLAGSSTAEVLIRKGEKRKKDPLLGTGSDGIIPCCSFSLGGRLKLNSQHPTGNEPETY
jgi:hypothetical protein